MRRSKNHFSVGIHDDVTGTSLDFNPSFSIEADDVFRAVFYGLGSDGTVGANKESIKIIGENTPFYAQAYFVYDSKKAGSMTISHLPFGPRPIRSSYLITQANFLACHQPEFLDRYSVFDQLMPHGKFLLNTPYASEEVWAHLPQSAIEQLVSKRPRFYGIDAHKVARECGMGGRINMIMQTCFFAISEILPRDQAIAAIKEHIGKAYENKGNEIVQRNLDAVDRALSHLVELQYRNLFRYEPTSQHRP
jgi:pyruvate-ferredoxin/flavodoxin oxidoreductase